ncbi:MAG: type IV pilus assembly protein PilM [Bacillota bacterium]
MAKSEVLSLDIGSKNIKLVIGKQLPSSVTVSAAFVFPAPANSIQDGKLLDMQAVAGCIKKVIEENKIKTKKAVLTIESTSIIRRELELPVVKESEMESMVRFEIEQYLPIMLSEYVVEYKILEEFMADNIKKCKILVAAISKAMVEEYLQLLRSLDLTPVVMDMHSNAVSKLFGSKQQINSEAYNLDKTAAIFDMGADFINLTIVAKGVTKFSRLVTMGGNDIDVNIANTFNLNTAHAEEKKIIEGNLGYDRESSSADAILNDTIRGSIDRCLEEIQRMFQYYTSRDTGNRIDEIYIYGGSSNLTGLEEYIRFVMTMPVHKIKSMSSVKLSKPEGAQLEYCLNAIGAILRK